MGFIIKQGDIITKKIRISQVEMENCGHTPVKLLDGKTDIFFQFLSIMANSSGGTDSNSPYVIIANPSNNIIAETDINNLGGTNQPCIFIIGGAVNNQNSQIVGNSLYITTKNGIDPSPATETVFYLLYKELYL